MTQEADVTLTVLVTDAGIQVPVNGTLTGTANKMNSDDQFIEFYDPVGNPLFVNCDKVIFIAPPPKQEPQSAIVTPPTGLYVPD